MYFAIIGDIENSRAIESRKDFQRDFHGILEELSGRARALASPYTVTLGDEFQALYSDPTSIMKDLFTLWGRLAPVKFRLSVGMGELDSDVNPRQALGMDGPAFHLAREGLIALKKHPGNRLGFFPGTGPVAAAGLDFLMADTRSWKPTTYAVLVGLMDGGNAESIGEQCGISERQAFNIMRNHGLREASALLAAVTEEIRRA